MQCPRWGLMLSEGVPSACPRCGLPFASPPLPPTLPLSHSPAAAPLYYAPPSGYGPYQPPVSPAHGNKRLFLIFGALAAVIVVAQGAHFDFYINGAHVGQTDDETIRDGQTALVVSGDSEAVFTNLTISQIN